jgi:hypothetical protein
MPQSLMGNVLNVTRLSALCGPFSARFFLLIFVPQGVALGWHVMAPSGRKFLQDGPR